jgi:hypothetical protein
MDTKNGKHVHVELTHVDRKFAGDISNKYIQRLDKQEKISWVAKVVDYLMLDMVAI